jgi:chemotaxis protein MotA
MALDTILGLVIGFGLFLVSILLSTDNFIIFVSFESLLMVLGGTLASTFISFRSVYVWQALKQLFLIVAKPRLTREVLKNEINRMIDWAYLVRKDGLLKLEDQIGKKSKDDLFYRHALELLVSGYKPQDVRSMLMTLADTNHERSMVSVNILRYMGSAAPAFGMIGTLVGLVVMLDNLDSNAGGIGSGLAVALVTTLYGVLFARLIFIPAANKIQQNLEILLYRNELMLEGFVLLANEQSPRFIQDRLNSNLPKELHVDISKRGK